MGGNATEIPLSPDEQSSEVQESNRSESTEASFNTTASEGDYEEPTLEHVLLQICKITSFTEVEAYLAVRDLTSSEGFNIAEQEDCTT